MDDDIGSGLPGTSWLQRVASCVLERASPVRDPLCRRNGGGQSCTAVSVLRRQVQGEGGCTARRRRRPQEVDERSYE